MSQNALAGIVGQALLGLLIVGVFGLAAWSRHSSATNDFRRALSAPDKARRFRRARFDANENLKAFRTVFSQHPQLRLTAREVEAISRVAPELASLFEPLIGKSALEAVSQVECVLVAEARRQEELKAQAQLAAMGQPIEKHQRRN